MSKDFNPYIDNGGTLVGIAGEDYVVLACDTRLAETEKYNILSRNISKIFEVNLFDLK